MKRPIAIAVLFLAPFARNARADGHCPDVKATQVDVRIDNMGSHADCGFGIVIFGFRITFSGPPCPPDRAVYPAHQACKGEASPGSFCETEGTMPVTREHCTCSLLGAGGIGISLPICTCTYTGQAGTVEDAHTGNCAHN